MATATLGWQAMGKPDFATCGKLFYRLPAELRELLNRSEEKVLIWSLFLTWATAYHSGRGTSIASYSESWVGKKFGKSRWTVARALSRLEGYNLLRRIRRNPKRNGTFQTNLIALGARLSALIAQTTRQPRDKSPCSKSAPQEVGNGYKRERTATFEQSASPSSSLSALQLREKMDAYWKKPEIEVEKGTLTRLFEKLRGDKQG